MLRRIRRILPWLSLAISVACLLSWPLSFYAYVRVARLGWRSSVHLSLGGGQVNCLVQTGPGLADVYTNAHEVQPPEWYFNVNPNHTRYNDARQLWKDSMSFDGLNRSMAMKSGRLVHQRLVVAPLWCPIWVFAMPPVILLQRYLRDHQRRRLGLCKRCGYDLRATPGRCPECGFTDDSPAPPAHNPRSTQEGGT